MMQRNEFKKILVISPYLPSLNKTTRESSVYSLLKTLSKVYEVFFVYYPNFQTPSLGLGITTFSLEKPIQDTFVSKIKEQLLQVYPFKFAIIVSHQLVKICLRELNLFYPSAKFVVYLPDLKELAVPRFKIADYACANLVLTNNKEDKDLFNAKVAFPIKVEVFSTHNLLGQLSALEKTHFKKEKKLTSIIVVTYNGLKYTKDCIKSLRQYTRLPYELIFVDNGSTDGTVRYLKSIPESKVIRNSTNLAFAKGNNQGIRIAKGDYILLINSDVIVTEGWLEGMLKWMESDNSIGMLGPCTNTAVGEQVVPNVPQFKTAKDLQHFAQAFRIERSWTCFEVHRIIGFCMLIRREVINKVGLLDERFGPGGFEDYDYCLRVRQSGYRIVIAGDVFIYHVGGRGYTWTDYNKLREHNREIFVEKWCRKALEFLEGI